MAKKKNPISEAYRAAIRAQNEAYRSSEEQSRRVREQSMKSLNEVYRSNVTNAQTAARISALGQEEKLAADGMSFGSAYEKAASGYTESARVAADNNLRGGLHKLDAARTASAAKIQNQYAAETADARRRKYENISALRKQRAEAQIAYRQQRYENALRRWGVYGYVLPADAKVLGVKAGTKSADQAYRQAKLAIDRIRALK